MFSFFLKGTAISQFGSHIESVTRAQELRGPKLFADKPLECVDQFPRLLAIWRLPSMFLREIDLSNQQATWLILPQLADS